MSPAWLVVLEAAASAHRDPLDLERITRLTSTLADKGFVGLHLGEDQTVVVMIEERSASAALMAAINRLRDAFRSIGLPVWHLVRAEVAMAPDPASVEADNPRTARRHSR